MPSDSWSYYARTYSRFFPEQDLLPSLVRLNISSSEVKDYWRLADFMQARDELEISQAVENLLITEGY